jgi:hypothetical protein
MRIKFISPIDVPPTPLLFDTMVETFIDNGHFIVDDIKEADCVMVDLHSGIGGYDKFELNIAVSNKMSFVFFDETDYGGCKDGTEEWFGFNRLDDNGYCNNMFGLITLNCPTVYFMRKVDKTKQFPSWVYPYELTQYPDHIFETVSEEELFNREYDIVWVGNESPTRRNTVDGLLKHGFNMKVVWTNETGKIEHNEWLNLHRQGKMFLTSCGGGFGDERPYQLIYISSMLRTKNNQLIVHNFREGLDCLEVSEHPTYPEIKILKDVLNNKEILYEIYLNGITRMRKYFNPKFRAQYILDTLLKYRIN